MEHNMLIHQVPNSSMISRIEYDKEENTLYVTFIKGGTYAYNVPDESIYTEMINADSVGKFFLSRIKGKFDTVKV
jgi:hypothetical protein